MDKNFRVRVVVGLGMFVAALISMYTLEEIPFKIIFGIFALLAAIELFSFFRKKCSAFLILLAAIQIVFLVLGTIYTARTDLSLFWYIVLGVPGYDVFAYLGGKALGGKIFGTSRPFPRISKNKTWEGTIIGLLVSFGLVAARMSLRGGFSTEYIYLFSGPLALVGDLFESYLKRRFGVKDSNEILLKRPVFRHLEVLVGGSEGHGGFLDRVDSVVFTTSVMLILSFVVK